MRFSLVALMLLGAVACDRALARLPSNSLAWRQFKQQHGKVYASQEEDARRFAIFMANKELVERHNANASRTFDMELNHLSDWTDEEYLLMKSSTRPADLLDVISDEELDDIIARDAPVPDEVDWRKVKGRVTDVKDQKRCGSCWAFSVIGLLEGQELPQNMSSLVPLSEQELVDCSTSNDKCAGGLMDYALADIVYTIGGIESEADYPYVGHSHSDCRVDKTKFVPLTVTGFIDLPENDEETLKKVVANYGPVSVDFYATKNFIHYKGGVFEDTTCDSIFSNHAVLIVGYGTDPQKGDYWIIKNSWSAKWGEQGYVRFRRGKNMCGISGGSTIAKF